MKIEDEKMPDYRKGRVMGVDERGNEFFLPKAEIHVGKTDVVARLLAAGSLVVATGGVLYHFLQPKVERALDEQAVKAIQTQQAIDEVALCVNENILRQAMGVPPIGLEDCQEEWSGWAEAIDATPTPTPEQK